MADLIGEQSLRNPYYGGQQPRPEHERNMSEAQRDALDRSRALDAQRRAENPALYRQLDRIEAKLDKLLNPDAD